MDDNKENLFSLDTDIFQDLLEELQPNRLEFKKEAKEMHKATLVPKQFQPGIKQELQQLQKKEIPAEERVEELAELMLKYPEELNPDLLYHQKRMQTIAEGRCKKGNEKERLSVVPSATCSDYENRLMTSICEVRGFLRGSNQENTTLEEACTKYDPAVAQDALTEAKKKYGELYLMQGVKESFLKLFNSFYKMKWNTYLAELYKAKAEAELQTSEGSIQDAVQDQEELQSFLERESLLEAIAERIGQFQELVELFALPQVRKDFIPFITLLGYEVNDRQPQLKLLLEDVVDQELVEFLERGDIPHDPSHRSYELEVFAAYKGITYDTARKRFREVEKFLKENITQLNSVA